MAEALLLGDPLQLLRLVAGAPVGSEHYREVLAEHLRNFLMPMARADLKSASCGVKNPIRKLCLPPVCQLVSSMLTIEDSRISPRNCR